MPISKLNFLAYQAMSGYAVRQLLWALICVQVVLAEPVIRYSNDLFPLSSTHLSLRPEEAWTASSGQTNLDVEYAWSNTFLLEPNYEVDVESRILRPEIHVGITADTELKASLPIVWRGGGVLDHLIKSWHDWFHLPEGNRDSRSDDAYAINGTVDNDTEFGWDDQGTSLGNAVLGANYKLWSNQDDSKTQVNLAVEFSLPTSKDTYGHNGIDSLLGLKASHRVEEWQFHAGTGLLALGDTDLGGVEYRRVTPQVYVASDYGVFNSLRVGLNLFAGQQLVENVRTFPDQFLYLDVGLFFDVTDQCSARVVIRENPFPSDGSTDVSGILGISYNLL